MHILNTDTSCLVRDIPCHEPTFKGARNASGTGFADLLRRPASTRRTEMLGVQTAGEGTALHEQGLYVLGITRLGGRYLLFMQKK